MTAAPDDPERRGSSQLDAELDVLLVRAGLQLDAGRRTVMRACLAEVRRWGDLIRAAPLAPADEPANTYDVRTIGVRAAGGAPDRTP